MAKLTRGNITVGYAPRLIRFIPLLLVASTAAIAVAYLLFVGLARLSGFNVSVVPGEASVASAQLFDLVRSTITAAGLFAGIFAIVYSYRRQRVEEAAGHRADAELLSKRYQDGVILLGNESVAVWLAGVYALEQLADQDPAHRGLVCDLMCSYLRVPFDNSARGSGEVVVRDSILTVIAKHLLTDFPENWCGHNLDFSGAEFNSGSLAGAQFVAGTVSFKGCQFTGSFSFNHCEFLGAHVSFGDGDSPVTTFDGDLTFIGCKFQRRNG